MKERRIKISIPITVYNYRLCSHSCEFLQLPMPDCDARCNLFDKEIHIRGGYLLRCKQCVDKTKGREDPKPVPISLRASSIEVRLAILEAQMKDLTEKFEHAMEP